MDLNLTGALAANISLMQPSKTDYLPLLTQIMTTLLTAFVTLGAIYLAQYLNTKSDARKRELEEEVKWQEDKKYAYRNFMEVFSSPISPNIDWNAGFSEITREHLEAALKAVEFGDELAIPFINLEISNSTKEITSLSILIRFILDLRCRSDLSFIEKINIFNELRNKAAESFGSSFITIITPKGITVLGENNVN
jgi:hypothetical protein